MRDLSIPLGVSMFDGKKPPKKSSFKQKRTKRKAIRRHERIRKQHEKRMEGKGSKDKDKSKSKSQPKSKFGEARGISTKAEDKKKVYCKPGKQLDKSCAGADPRGFKESGRD